MTPRTRRPAENRRPAPVTDLFIEFDGQQLEIRTDIPSIRNFFERTYRPMLVSGLRASAGRLEVLSTRSGYSIRGLETRDVEGHRPELILDYLRRDVLYQFIRSRPDLLWIHAAAVERNGFALLIVGPSLQGKSTISTRLCENGWRFMSDDMAPVRMSSNDVLPFPQSPRRRKYPGRELEAAEMSKFDVEEIHLPASELRMEPAPVRGIVFPLFRHRAVCRLSLRNSAESALDLMRNCTNLVDCKEPAFDCVARLANSVPIYHLSYGDGLDAAQELLRRFDEINKCDRGTGGVIVAITKNWTSETKVRR